MVEILNKAINNSYNYLETYVGSLSPVITRYFKNQEQCGKINELTSQDFFTIKEWI